VYLPFVGASQRDQQVRIEEVRLGRVGHELDCPLVLLFRIVPVPFQNPVIAQADMRFGERVIQFDRSQRRGFCLWERLPGLV